MSKHGLPQAVDAWDVGPRVTIIGAVDAERWATLGNWSDARSCQGMRWSLANPVALCGSVLARPEELPEPRGLTPKNESRRLHQCA